MTEHTKPIAVLYFIAAVCTSLKGEAIIGSFLAILGSIFYLADRIYKNLSRSRTQQLWQPISTFPKCQDADQAGENTALLFTEQGQVVEGYWTPTGKDMMLRILGLRESLTALPLRTGGL